MSNRLEELKRKQTEVVFNELSKNGSELGMMFVIWLALNVCSSIVLASGLGYWVVGWLGEVAPHLSRVNIVLGYSGVAFWLVVFNTAVNIFALMFFVRFTRSIDSDNEEI